MFRVKRSNFSQNFNINLITVHYTLNYTIAYQLSHPHFNIFNCAPSKLYVYTSMNQSRKVEKGRERNPIPRRCGTISEKPTLSLYTIPITRNARKKEPRWPKLNVRPSVALRSGGWKRASSSSRSRATRLQQLSHRPILGALAFRGIHFTRLVSVFIYIYACARGIPTAW